MQLQPKVSEIQCEDKNLANRENWLKHYPETEGNVYSTSTVNQEYSSFQQQNLEHIDILLRRRVKLSKVYTFLAAKLKKTSKKALKWF